MADDVRRRCRPPSASRCTLNGSTLVSAVMVFAPLGMPVDGGRDQRARHSPDGYLDVPCEHDESGPFGTSGVAPLGGAGLGTLRDGPGGWHPRGTACSRANP